MSQKTLVSRRLKGMVYPEPEIGSLTCLHRQPSFNGFEDTNKKNLVKSRLETCLENVTTGYTSKSYKGFASKDLQSREKRPIATDKTMEKSSNNHLE